MTPTLQRAFYYQNMHRLLNSAHNTRVIGRMPSDAYEEHVWYALNNSGIYATVERSEYQLVRKLWPSA